jgi:hypothetical protein
MSRQLLSSIFRYFKLNRHSGFLLYNNSTISYGLAGNAVVGNAVAADVDALFCDSGVAEITAKAKAVQYAPPLECTNSEVNPVFNDVLINNLVVVSEGPTGVPDIRLSLNSASQVAGLNLSAVSASSMTDVDNECVTPCRGLSN